MNHKPIMTGKTLEKLALMAKEAEAAALRKPLPPAGNVKVKGLSNTELLAAAIAELESDALISERLEEKQLRQAIETECNETLED